MPRTSVIGEKDGSGDSSNKAWVFLFFPKNKKLAEEPYQGRSSSQLRRMRRGASPWARQPSK